MSTSTITPSTITTGSTFTDAAVATTVHTTPRRRLGRPGFIGGIGGLVFVAGVIAQNAIRSGFPPNDASAQEVLTYYADHRGATAALAVLFPLGLAGLLAFVGTVVNRCIRGNGRVAAIAGAVGAAGIIGTFMAVIASDLALSAYIHRGAADVSVVEGIWVLHNAIFGVLLAAVGVTLAALSSAAATEGLIPARWRTAGLVGAGLLMLGAMSAPAILDGSPMMVAGLAGFAVWIAFMIRSSVALLRRPAG